MRWWALFFFIFSTIEAGEISSPERLFEDLEQVKRIDKEIKDELPFIFNYIMQGGYFTMPSARMPKAGCLGFGFAYLPPYRIWSLSFQFFGRLELGGNYWLYHGLLDSTLGPSGFGDEAERCGNVKLVLLKKEDGFAFLPEIAIGINDFIGTKRFHSVYGVATKEFLKLNLEVSLGWGKGRIKGFFGGIAWTPFRNFDNPFKWLSFCAEYDANNYKHHAHEHPKGRDVLFPVNIGCNLNLFDILHIKASSIRGKDYALSSAISYNFGETKGFFKKVEDPLPYNAPMDIEPLGKNRNEEEFAQELAYAFKDQGFDLYAASMQTDSNKRKKLWLKVVNVRYREEEDVRDRIVHVFSSLLPKDVYSVEIVIEAEGLLCHEYHFLGEDLRKLSENKMGSYELALLSPLKNATPGPSYYDAALLYQKQKSSCLLTFRPTLRTYFGSSKGKIKYDVGVSGLDEGYLWDQVYYELQVGYTIKSCSESVGDRDRLNPSRIWNVRTDIIRYYHTNSFHLDMADLQKNWNLSKGFFARASFGYFEIAYAGVAAEALYYPPTSNWSLGIEWAALLKRKYHGVWFVHELRRWKGDEAVFKHYRCLQQYFVNFYFDFKPLESTFKISAGQFLAGDKGVKFEIMRCFRSGLQVSFWYAFTNGGDVINGKRYFDKGFSISFPLDFFLNKSSKTMMAYSMSAWLRDIAAKAYTGKELHTILYNERLNN